MVVLRIVCKSAPTTEDKLSIVSSISETRQSKTFLKKNTNLKQSFLFKKPIGDNVQPKKLLPAIIDPRSSVHEGFSLPPVRSAQVNTCRDEKENKDILFFGLSSFYIFRGFNEHHENMSV